MLVPERIEPVEVECEVHLMTKPIVIFDHHLEPAEDLSCGMLFAVAQAGLFLDLCRGFPNVAVIAPLLPVPELREEDRSIDRAEKARKSGIIDDDLAELFERLRKLHLALLLI